MNTYLTALKSCNIVIFEFYADNNEFLPDEKGEYCIDWTLEICNYLKEEIDHVVKAILSSPMADHWAYEATEVSRKFNESLKIATKTGNLTACKTAFINAVEELGLIRGVCIDAIKMIEG